MLSAMAYGVVGRVSVCVSVRGQRKKPKNMQQNIYSQQTQSNEREMKKESRTADTPQRYSYIFVWRAYHISYKYILHINFILEMATTWNKYGRKEIHIRNINANGMNCQPTLVRNMRASLHSIRIVCIFVGFFVRNAGLPESVCSVCVRVCGIQ